MRKGSGTNLGFKPHLHLGLAFRTHFNRVSSYSVPNVLVENGVVLCSDEWTNTHMCGSHTCVGMLGLCTKNSGCNGYALCPSGSDWWRLLESGQLENRLSGAISRIREQTKVKVGAFSRIRKLNASNDGFPDGSISLHALRFCSSSVICIRLRGRGQQTFFRSSSRS